MWYINKSSAQGTEEDRDLDYAFKVLLLNVASEKHISKLFVWHHSSKSSFGHVLYTYVALPAFSLHSLFLHAPVVNYALGGGGHGTT